MLLLLNSVIKCYIQLLYRTNSCCLEVYFSFFSVCSGTWLSFDVDEVSKNGDLGGFGGGLEMRKRLIEIEALPRKGD